MQHSADLPYIYTMKVALRYVTRAVGINYYHAFYWVHYLKNINCSVCAMYLSPLTNSHLYFQVKWAKENYHHNVGSPYSLRLASADATGKIIVWDVATGAARCEIQEHSKPIQGNDSAWCLYGIILWSIVCKSITCLL